MKIIDANLQLMKSKEFDLDANNAGHMNTPEHLKKIYMENNIEQIIVMGIGNWNPKGDRAYGGPMIPNLEYWGKIEDENLKINYCLGVKSGELLNMEYSQQRECLYIFEREMQNKKCVGIKLYPGYEFVYAHDAIHRPLFEMAAKYNLPVVVHTGSLAGGKGILKYSHPLTIDELAVEFPRVKFVIEHCGAPWICDAVEVASKNSNVHIDIAGLAGGKFSVEWFLEHHKDFCAYLKMWLNYFGDYTRVIFGTGWPRVGIESYIKLIMSIIPESEHADVFYGNAVELYNLRV